MIRCSVCGREHDPFATEARYRLPDACVAVPAGERPARLAAADDWVRLADPARGATRWFLRVLLPFPVHGQARAWRWSAWAEVEERVYWRVMELWDEPAQAAEARLPGSLANAIAGDPGSLGLAGEIELVSPSHAPRFWIAAGTGHPLAAAQRDGVSRERVLAWVSPFLHPPG